MIGEVLCGAEAENFPDQRHKTGRGVVIVRTARVQPTPMIRFYVRSD